MKNGQVTIKDIAKKLNISVATVSRALRDIPDISNDTKKAVVALAKELEYQPNSVAQSLVKNRTNTIGVIIPGLISHFYCSAISGIQKVASKAGYHVMICQSSESYQTEVANLQAMVSSRVDGLIISVSKETRCFEHFRSLQKKNIPLVFFNRVIEEIDVSKVVVDDYEGAFKATEHLIVNGCQKIAHLAGPQNLLICKDRLNGYLDALKKHNLSVDQSLISQCDFTMESGITGTKHLLQAGSLPDAIFAVCDAAAFGAMSVIKERNLKLPDDIAIVGFTNEPVASWIEPSLSTIAQPTYEIGRVAAELLIDQIKHSATSYRPQIKVLQTGLIIRQSSVKQLPLEIVL